VSTNYAKSQTIVTFDSSRVSYAAIKKIITKNGYTVEREEEQK
jgi:copper chaperone CopZ